MTDVYGSQENIVSEPTTKIKGIGATTAEKLYNVKIITVRQIAEMTPEKLSETPGIGLASAMKFIAAAKIYLSGSQKGEIANNSPQVVTSVTDESSSELIKNYEIVEVVVDEIQEISKEAPTEISEAFEQSQLNLKWFPDKFNYSRLTASYPPISKLGKNIDERVKEEENFVIEWDKDNNLNAPTEYEKEPTREIIPEINSGHDEPELKNIIEDERVDYTPSEPKIIDFGDSRENILESSTNQQISTIFKDVGCYEIPCSLESLNQFTTNLDYLGCKLVIASDDLKFLFLFPVKWVDEEGTVLVEETKLELKSHAKRNDLGSYNKLKQISQNLLQTRDSMYEDLVNNQNIREFFQKYLQITLSFERGFGNKSLLFLSGSTQYKVVIEPILLCNNSPRSMEKRLAFPYQRSSNLHAVTKLDLVPLIKFLEKKYRMIEKRTKKTNLTLE
ncbi:MAG: helix-hairpin-helix domain-containing protein [Promethearchaeota archaeon]